MCLRTSHGLACSLSTVCGTTSAPGNGYRTRRRFVRRHGISRETFYKWRRKYGGIKVDEAKRLRMLEEENRRLKRVVADQVLNIQVLKDLLGKECGPHPSGGPRSAKR